MRGVAIYMEGGSDSRDTKTALRQGMEAFLITIKEAVREKSWRWKLVCCGSRDETFRKFRKAFQVGEYAITVLLVDAEAPVEGPVEDRSVRDHLRSRDGWDFDFVSAADVIHLMIQTIETWIVADQQALAKYYGQGFRGNELPKTINLETVAKTKISGALNRSIRHTQKGLYHKIRHASDLLKKIDPQHVASRCPSCARLFATLFCMLSDEDRTV